MDKLLAILSVNKGDIVQIGLTEYYFHVTDVVELSHPDAGGVVWHGSYFQWKDHKWSKPTVVHMHEGKPRPMVIDQATREMFGWNEIV
ncbi:hypothetical protein [Amycolatopsis sp. PS_44_ISF1]|uniref:hypothetical protein n=1 Tax=Amycolatopsis sp. PS_44_ISF1 TaxID=2974917 RepID=UPI0028DE0ECE|nr:hypothetical protein [Amycolatopsis sp. PS_44_ISF1]MDT8913585.1 hypothetical protein [Amycolatopsis sp. PS_44_ISF1]